MRRFFLFAMLFMVFLAVVLAFIPETEVVQIDTVATPISPSHTFYFAPTTNTENMSEKDFCLKFYSDSTVSNVLAKCLKYFYE